jgi:hypothetical protein
VRGGRIQLREATTGFWTRRSLGGRTWTCTTRSVDRAWNGRVTEAGGVAESIKLSRLQTKSRTPLAKDKAGTLPASAPIANYRFRMHGRRKGSGRGPRFCGVPGDPA